MHHIIVGFDGSKSAVAALTWAVDEARLHNARLTAWMVFDQPPAGREARPVGVDEVRTAEELRQAVEAVINGFPADIRFGHGGAAAELTAACADADLLVVGSRGRNPFAGLLLGSVSRACVYHAPCAVVVVRPQPHPVRAHGRVVVGLDASAHARRALCVAAEEARLRGVALYAVHAVHWDHLGAEWVVPDTRELVAWGRHLVSAELDATGVSARPVVIHGHAPEVLVRHSTHADLLVLGSRGHNPLASLLLGSTSDYCARHATCPVMIVRPGGS